MLTQERQLVPVAPLLDDQPIYHPEEAATGSVAWSSDAHTSCATRQFAIGIHSSRMRTRALRGRAASRTTATAQFTTAVTSL